MLYSDRNAARHVWLLRKHFALRQLESGRFSIKAKTRSGLEYLLNPISSRSGIHGVVLALDESVVLELIADWTEEEDPVLLRIVLTRWVAAESVEAA
jgi:hypothetical protein